MAKRGTVVGKTQRGLPKPMRFPGFTPYIPPPPPSGSYDPALDAQKAAAGRGYGDLQQDIGTANERAAVDFGLERDDYNRRVGLLTQSYQRLQRTQAERARASGVTSGGLALQAAAKRAANMATDKQPLDLAMGKAGLAFQRGGIDRGTQLFRAGRENTFFGLDIGAQEAFQAAQSGYIPPGRGEPGGIPKTEHIDPKTGEHYQDRAEGGYIVRYDRFGNVISRRRRPGAKASLVGAAGVGTGGLGGLLTGRAGL